MLQQCDPASLRPHWPSAVNYVTRHRPRLCRNVAQPGEVRPFLGYLRLLEGVVQRRREIRLAPDRCMLCRARAHSLQEEHVLPPSVLAVPMGSSQRVPLSLGVQYTPEQSSGQTPRKAHAAATHKRNRTGLHIRCCHSRGGRSQSSAAPDRSEVSPAASCCMDRSLSLGSLMRLLFRRIGRSKFAR